MAIEKAGKKRESYGRYRKETFDVGPPNINKVYAHLDNVFLNAFITTGLSVEVVHREKKLIYL